MMSVCINMLLTMLLLGLCTIPGKRDKNASEDCFTVREGRRAFVIGSVGTLMLVFSTTFGWVERQSLDMTTLLLLAMLWLIIGFPGIAFLLCYVNRKFSFNHGTLIYQGTLFRKMNLLEIPKHSTMKP